MKHLVLVFLCIVGIGFSSICQLAGVYTIGGVSPDYNTLSSAINAIEYAGTSDTVVFEIRDGEYVDHYFIDIEPDNKVIFRGENDALSEVEIVETGVNFNLHGCSNLSFQSLRFSSQNHLIKSSWGENIEFIGCEFFSENGYDLLNMNWNEGLIIIKDNVFHEGDVDVSGGSSTFIQGNISYGNCDFGSGGFFNVIEDNRFEGHAKLPSGVLVTNNEFYNGCTASHESGVEFLNNVVYSGHANFAYCHSTILYSNIFKGEVHFSFGSNHRIANNIFQENVFIGHIDDGQFKFYFNNIREGSYLRTIYYSTQDIRSNNFSEPVIFYFGVPEFVTNMSNNNYYPQYGEKGINLHHIDPEYISYFNTQATNPALAGMGSSVSSVLFDFYDNARPDPPSIGATELCLNQDSIVISCGQSLQLSFCPTQIASDYFWTPVIYMDDSTSSMPTVRPENSTTYFLHDSLSILDSVTVIVTPFELQLADDQTITCGYGGLLFDTPLDTSLVDYYWTPLDSIHQYGDYLWYANPLDTTVYTMHLTHELCGSYLDSVQLMVNPLPYSLAYVDSVTIYGEAYFSNHSTCADSYIWIIDEIDTLYSEDLMYTFDTVGLHYYTLIAQNSYGEDYSQGVAYVSWIVGVDDIEAASDQLKIFPNPTDGELLIEFKGQNSDCNLVLYDMSGKRLYSQSYKCDIGIIRLDLNEMDLQAGSYILGLSNNEFHASEIVIVK